MNRAVFLDRDGVIIRTDVRDGKPYAITSLDALEVLDGAGDAIQRLKDAGFVRGLRRRIRRDGTSGPGDCVLGR